MTDNLSILIHNKNEYVNKLVKTLIPPIITGFQSIYDNTRKKNKFHKYLLKEFQNELSQTPNWSQSIIDGEFERIKAVSSCEWLDDLIKNIFLVNAEILSITTNKENKNKKYTINMPTPPVFIHKCYINIARLIWKTPQLYYHKLNKIEIINNNEKIKHIIEDTIKDTILQLMPLEDFIIYNKEDLKDKELEISSESEEESVSESELDSGSEDYSGDESEKECNKDNSDLDSDKLSELDIEKINKNNELPKESPQNNINNMSEFTSPYSKTSIIKEDFIEKNVEPYNSPKNIFMKSMDKDTILDFNRAPSYNVSRDLDLPPLLEDSDKENNTSDSNLNTPKSNINLLINTEEKINNVTEDEEVNKEFKEELITEYKDIMKSNDNLKNNIIEQFDEKQFLENNKYIIEKSKEELTKESKEEYKEESREEFKEELTKESKEEYKEESREEFKEELTKESKEELEELTEESKEELEELTEESKEEPKEKLDNSKEDLKEELEETLKEDSKKELIEEFTESYPINSNSVDLKVDIPNVLDENLSDAPKLSLGTQTDFNSFSVEENNNPLFNNNETDKIVEINDEINNKPHISRKERRYNQDLRLKRNNEKIQNLLGLDIDYKTFVKNKDRIKKILLSKSIDGF